MYVPSKELDYFKKNELPFQKCIQGMVDQFNHERWTPAFLRRMDKKHLMNLVTLCLYHFPARKYCIKALQQCLERSNYSLWCSRPFRLLLHSPFPVYLLLSPLGTHCPVSMVHFSDTFLPPCFFFLTLFFSRMPFWLFLLC